MSLIITPISLGYTAENIANKGAANGYAGLDGTSKVAAANLPSYVDDVLEYANLAALPGTGTTGLIYVALDTNKIYRWSGSAYIEIAASPGTTDAVTEGSVNLYFTTARARASISATQNITYNSTTGVITGPASITSTYTRITNTATAGQTVFTATYTIGYIEVFVNGALLPPTDYTATNGTSITLGTAATLNTIVETKAYAMTAIGTSVTTGKAIAMAMIFGG